MRTRLRGLRIAMLGFGLMSATVVGQAQEPDAPTAIAARRDAYKEMGAALKSLNDELKRPKPIAFNVQRGAAMIGKTANRLANWFPDGSGPSSGIETGAKPEIWTRRAEFDAIQRKLVAESAQLEKTVAGGDLKAVAAQVKSLAGVCKSCHGKFRERV